MNREWFSMSTHLLNVHWIAQPYRRSWTWIIFSLFSTVEWINHWVEDQKRIDMLTTFTIHQRLIFEYRRAHIRPSSLFCSQQKIRKQFTSLLFFLLFEYLRNMIISFILISMRIISALVYIFFFVVPVSRNVFSS
jgi:hypothetical protein